MTALTFFFPYFIFAALTRQPHGFISLPYFRSARISAIGNLLTMSGFFESFFAILLITPSGNGFTGMFSNSICANCINKTSQALQLQCFFLRALLLLLSFPFRFQLHS